MLAPNILKAESQQVFLDFFGVSAESPRRKRAGIYHAQTYGKPGQRIQVILLDTRYFRSPLNNIGRPKVRTEGRTGPYGITKDPDATILGEEQWQWLEDQLLQPAELRIVASSIQVVSDQHGWECWGTMPSERKRLYDLLNKTTANGVVVLRETVIMQKFPVSKANCPTLSTISLQVDSINVRDFQTNITPTESEHGIVKSISE